MDTESNLDDMTQILLDAFLNKFLISLEETCEQNDILLFIKNILNNFRISIENRKQLFISKYDILDKLKYKAFNEIKEINDILNQTLEENKYNPNVNNILFNLNAIKNLIEEFVSNRNVELFDFFHE